MQKLKLHLSVLMMKKFPQIILQVTSRIWIDRCIKKVIQLSFTATGKDLWNEGTKAKRYEVRYAKNKEYLKENWDAASLLQDSNIIDGGLEPKDQGTKMELSIDRTIFDKESTYYIALKAYDNAQQASPISNIVEFHNFESINPGSEVPEVTEDQKSTENNTGVIIGSVFGVVLLILIIIICVIYRDNLTSLCQSNESQPINQADEPEAQKLKTITLNE